MGTGAGGGGEIVISEPDTHYTRRGVSQGCLREEGRAISMRFMCVSSVVCVVSCESPRETYLDCISDAFEPRRSGSPLLRTAAYYRMARTIRFNSRSPRYFRRASPIPLRSIRHRPRSAPHTAMGKIRPALRRYLSRGYANNEAAARSLAYYRG